MLKILGRATSINVRKVLWTAEELGLACEREEWGLPMRDTRVPEFLKLNPNGLVPVLVEDDFVLWESNAIMRYLATRGGSQLLPTEPRQQALMDQWLGWQVTELAPTWIYAFLAYGRPTPGYDDRAKIDGSIDRWSKRMAILEGQLADGRAYVIGDALTLADIALGVAVHRWFATPFEKPGLPAVEAYYRRVKSRPAAGPHVGAKTP